MRRWLTTILVTAALLVAGCSGEDPTRQRLNEQLESIREAAAAGDLGTAQRELDRLEALVREAVERGDLSQERAEAILAAASDVERDLAALTEAPPQEPTEEPPPDRQRGSNDHEDEEDEEDEEEDEEDEEDKKEKEKEQEKEEEGEGEGEDED